MDYLEKAKQLTALAGKAVGSAHHGSAQTVTVRRPRAVVEQFWYEPENLSRVFHGIADVRSTGADRYEWAVGPEGAEVVRWETVVVPEENGMRFVDAAEDDAVRIRIGFAAAPHDLGTEVRISAAAPLPDKLTDAGLFTALYRARALLQTGEAPTLEHNPSARSRATTEEA
ncbi:hypothetical protein [Nocardia sp. X0981]